MITSVDVCILRARHDVSSKYLTYLFSSAQYLNFMEGQCRGGTRDRVSRSFLGAVRVTVPPYKEQCGIADTLDAEIAEVESLLTLQQHSIALLQERRAALITAAVTGQIDVRGVASADMEAA